MSKPEVVDCLSRLISFPSVSDRPVTEIAAFLAQQAEDAGFKVQQLPSTPGKSNVVARMGPQGQGGIVLSGHMDVVPTEGQAWQTDPFQLSIDDDRLVGRGTADMKGFIAAVSTAIQRTRVDELKREVVLVWTHDEEVGCVGAQHLVDQWRDTLSPLPPDTWIGEPTGFHLCHSHPGHTTLDIACRGRPAHSSRPQLGLSAIQLASDVLQALDGVAQRWLDAAQGGAPLTALNVGEIAGGEAVNIVPEHCRLTVGFRPVPGQSDQALIEEVMAALEPAVQAARTRGGEIQIRVRQSSPPMLTDPDTPLGRTLCRHASSATPISVPFSTDGGHLSRLGTRCLVFGPGSIDVAHRPNESISATALEQTVEIVHKVIHERCT